jgi:hypothetical protein
MINVDILGGFDTKYVVREKNAFIFFLVNIFFFNLKNTQTSVLYVEKTHGSKPVWLRRTY